MMQPKMIEEESLIDLYNSSTIPMTAGNGPLGTLQVDPRIQDRKEERLKAIETWIVAEKDTSKKLSIEMTDQEAEFKRDFNTDVILAKRERCMRKMEMLTKIFSATAQTEGKLYGNDPATEWVLEFRLKWEKCGGTELDQKVTEEYTKQALRLTQDLESEDLWKEAWSTIEEPQRTRPPPSSPPFV